KQMAEEEGIRAHRFRETFLISLDKAASSVDVEDLKKCYPSVAALEGSDSLFADILSQVTDFWRTRSLKEFDLILKEKNVTEKLNELDEIIESGKQLAESGAPEDIQIENLTPAQILNAHSRNVKQNIIDRLNSLSLQIEQVNNKLDDQIDLICRSTAEDLKSLQSLL
ncbi:hypothetical protein CANCADRAFT_12601, partial [Tortispora caseinolytica NRRL Y-17796]